MDEPDDCEITCLHPYAVRAARAHLPESNYIEAMATLFSVLGDPTRVRLLTALLPGELCVCDLATATRLNRTTVSHQLRILRDHHVVRRRRDGKVVYYSLADTHVTTLLGMGAEHAAEPLETRISAKRLTA